MCKQYIIYIRVGTSCIKTKGWFHYQLRKECYFYGEGGSWEGLFWMKVHWRKARGQDEDGFSLAELQE